MVAILFCFMNSEVIVQLKRFINISIDGINRQGQSLAMTQYTVIACINILCKDFLRGYNHKFLCLISIFHNLSYITNSSRSNTHTHTLKESQYKHITHKIRSDHSIDPKCCPKCPISIPNDHFIFTSSQSLRYLLFANKMFSTPVTILIIHLVCLY